MTPIRPALLRDQPRPRSLSFLSLFRQPATLLLVVVQPQILLAEVFYGFTCHDRPPTIEDAHDEFFASMTGLFQRNLPELRRDVRHPTRHSARRRHSIPPCVSQDHHLRITEVRGVATCDARVHSPRVPSMGTSESLPHPQLV